MLKRLLGGCLIGLTIFMVGLAAATMLSMRPLPDSLNAVVEEASHAQVLARNGEPLSMTYSNRWNVHDIRALHDIPPFLREAFIASEDRRFREHGGVDWRARLSAVEMNIRNLRGVRGASTLTEQVVRMIHPRPRTVWSRWVEGFEAMALEQTTNKDSILEFYLNQVPYAANRRGVAQAARHYFNRDLDTLSKKEMLVLAVLVRAPSRMDLFTDTASAEAAAARLAAYLKLPLDDTPLALDNPSLPVSAPKFVSAVQQHPNASGKRIHTTLDAHLQSSAQSFLDSQLAASKHKNLRHGAVLVADHTTGEVLAWAVGDNAEDAAKRTTINAVTTPRQPGSALKPFLYALALEKGWTPATLIDDAPLVEMVGSGLHDYQNYSRHFYGWVTLREALGNSLNIPALKALQFVGGKDYLARLSQAGFKGLNAHPDVYGDGLALGNGEVTLFELVQAYATLANRGNFRPLRLLEDEYSQSGQRVFAETSASLIGNILSDSRARRLEFGVGSVLNLPVQTAVKTGTSSDYRDAWSVGYNYRYVVGVWMGNLDQTPTDGVTGSAAPSLLLRSIFAELTRHQDTRPLYLSPLLTLHQQGKNSEWFDPEFPPQEITKETPRLAIRLRRPTHGLHLAYDPRIPQESQAFQFLLQGTRAGDEIRWNIDGETHSSYHASHLWPVARGTHKVSVEIWRDGECIATDGPVTFLVK